MDGVHDLGGKPGFGEVEREDNEPVFHARWEARVRTMVPAVAMAGGFYNTDQFRHAIERINPEAYLNHGYYGRWLGGLENLLTERDILSTGEINKRVEAMGGDLSDLIAAQPNPQPDPIGDIPRTSHAGRHIENAPAFKVGDEVITTTEVVAGHTRLPGYARGKTGEVVTHHDGWVYPDTNAHGKGEQPTHLYTVRFRSTDLFGQDAEVFDLHLDLFEPYLLPVTRGVK